MRRLADKILDHAQGIMPAHDAGWSKAMRAEAEHIHGDWASVSFAIGCLKTASLAHLRAARWEPLARALLCFHISIWVAAKFYCGVKLTQAAQDGRVDLSGVQTGLIGLAGFAYMGIGLCLISRKWVAAIGFGLAALALNTLHLMRTIFTASPLDYPVTDLDVFSLALISEEYFIWTTILVGGAGLWLWQTRFNRIKT